MHNCLSWAIEERARRGGVIKIWKWSIHGPHYCLDHGTYLVDYWPYKLNYTRPFEMVLKGYDGYKRILHKTRELKPLPPDIEHQLVELYTFWTDDSPSGQDRFETLRMELINQIP